MVGLDGLAHTRPHSVVTIAPSVSDATIVFSCTLCGHRMQVKTVVAMAVACQMFKWYACFVETESK